MPDILLILRLAIALNMLSFGLSQLWHPEKWLQYIPPFIQKWSPVAPKDIMRIHSLGNILLGSALLFVVWPNATLLLTLIWWLSILPLAYIHNWRIGVRDTVITLAILTLFVTKNA
ncbi:hypothetical protein LRY65_05850 [Candidatus Woesebacteria bacterium]|nr:hypothetical protein [Candidatus Woesebacteria bacterium]MCD8506775.1 hypothetical protein [Candidatus Woesebacteria bacterium]MCD8527685.1 hypothetical protein [Candidatus Woesebacteria bacterium]MCD8546347.1 hypothetical protein [Candidatus Woesebacteria bacterium]